MKKPKITSELSFKKYFRKFLEENGYWTQSVEPGLGGDVGAADLWIQKGDFCIPIELKFGDGKLRAEQIAWAEKRARFGLKTFLARYKDDKVTIDEFSSGEESRNSGEVTGYTKFLEESCNDGWFGR